MYISGRPLRAGRWRCSRAPPPQSARQSSTTRARVRSFKLERSAGPVCVDNLAVSDGPGTVVALRPVGEVTARSEPSLLRLLDSDKTGQISRACDRLSSFCKKLRRTISECPYHLPVHQNASDQLSTFIFYVSG